jgi:ammonia channel protein AmtB
MLHIDPAATAWLLASTALVMLMTPGLAIFYGGMVRTDGVLNMIMMSFVLYAGDRRASRDWTGWAWILVAGGRRVRAVPDPSPTWGGVGGDHARASAAG